MPFWVSCRVFSEAFNGLNPIDQHKSHYTNERDLTLWYGSTIKLLLYTVLLCLNFWPRRVLLRTFMSEGISLASFREVGGQSWKLKLDLQRKSSSANAFVFALHLLTSWPFIVRQSQQYEQMHIATITAHLNATFTRRSRRVFKPNSASILQASPGVRIKR